jgi:hypothetical protein
MLCRLGTNTLNRRFPIIVGSANHRQTRGTERRSNFAAVAINEDTFST